MPARSDHLNGAGSLLLLMAVFAKPLFTLVRGHLMALSLFSRGHGNGCFKCVL